MNGPWLYNFFITDTLLLHWRDMSEIVFFSLTFYHITRWLKHDRTKNLLPPFYGCCLATCGAYWLQLNTISHFAFLFSPAIAMLFILMHQETLQRNIVAMKQIKPKNAGPHNWIETLIRTALIANTHKKNVCYLIEHTDSIDGFVDTPFMLCAPIRKELLELIFSSSIYDMDTMIWINSDGTVRSINTQWKTQSDFFWSSPTSWHQEALLYSKKTDAIIIHSNIQDDGFTIISHGTIVHNIATHHVIQYIQSHVHMPVHTHAKKGEVHAVTSQKSSIRQRTP